VGLSTGTGGAHVEACKLGCTCVPGAGDSVCPWVAGAVVVERLDGIVRGCGETAVSSPSSCRPETIRWIPVLTPCSSVLSLVMR
jgi:hypothetical protein